MKFALQAAKEDDKETLKLLDNPALFIHGLIKQRLLLVSGSATTILNKGILRTHATCCSEVNIARQHLKILMT